jgi:YfiH family protein
MLLLDRQPRAVMHDWIVPDWPAPPSVKSVITTRSGGVSTGPFLSLNLSLAVGDDPRAVRRNRALLREILPREPVWLGQVHGTRVVDAGRARANAEADAAIATEPHAVCAVMVADCLPVLLCNRTGTRVAVAHAGWRGLSAGVLESTIEALSSAPADLLAFLGPAIGPHAFEVGSDVLHAFSRLDPAAAAAFVAKPPAASGEEKWFADLYALARLRLARVGVHAVFGGGWCTHGERERFFSHRRDRQTGRQAALIWLAG